MLRAECDEMSLQLSVSGRKDSSLVTLYLERAPCQVASILATAKRHGAAGHRGNRRPNSAALGTPRRGQLLAKDGQGAEIGQLQDLRHLNLLVGIAGAIGARAKDQLSC